MRKLRFLLISGVPLVVVAFLLSANNIASKSIIATAEKTSEKWQVASLPDTEQANNPSVPVAVVRVTSGLSDQDADSKKQYLVKDVIVENRSGKNVSSVTIRWAIAPMNSRLTILSRGELQPHNLNSLHKHLFAGQRQTLKLSHPKIGNLLREIPNLDAMGGKFAVIIGVGQVVFEDGSTWKEEVTEVTKKRLRPEVEEKSIYRSKRVSLTSLS